MLKAEKESRRWNYPQGELQESLLYHRADRIHLLTGNDSRPKKRGLHLTVKPQPLRSMMQGQLKPWWDRAFMEVQSCILPGLLFIFADTWNMGINAGTLQRWKRKGRWEAEWHIELVGYVPLAGFLRNTKPL